MRPPASGRGPDKKREKIRNGNPCCRRSPAALWLSRKVHKRRPDLRRQNEFGLGSGEPRLAGMTAGAAQGDHKGPRRGCAQGFHRAVRVWTARPLACMHAETLLVCSYRPAAAPAFCGRRAAVVCADACGGEEQRAAGMRAGQRGHLLRAASSAMTMTSGWSWRMEAGTREVTGPKQASRMASALSSPLAASRIFRDCMMACIPRE
jgi:hypothetical protein